MSTSALADSTDIESVPLIKSSDYKPADKKTWGQFFEKRVADLGGGTIAKYTSLDLKKEVLKALSADELKSYYPDKAEREAIAAEIEKKAYATTLKGWTTSEKGVKTIELVVREVTNRTIERALKAEKITDPERTQAWSAKVLAPFSECITKAKVGSEASLCQEAFKKDVSSNIGLAIGYETVKAEVGPKYVETQVKSYTECVSAGAQPDLGKDSGKDVRGCALDSIRTSVYSMAKDEVMGFQSGRGFGGGEGLNRFRACIEKESDKTGFNKCAGGLFLETGRAFVRSEVEEDARVRKYISKSRDLDNVVNTAQKTFEECYEKIGTSSLKSIDEKQLGACKSDVKKAAGVKVAQIVLTEKMDNFIRRSGGSNSLPISEGKLLDKVAETLNTHEKCVNSDTTNADVDKLVNKCLKENATKLLTPLANSVLDAKISESMRGNDKELIEKRESLGRELKASLAACLKDQDVDGLDTCVEDLERKAARQIAVEAGRAQVRLQLKTSEMPKAVRDSEVELNKCVMQSLPAPAVETRIDAPTLSQGEVCAREHAIRVAKTIGPLKLKLTLGNLIGANGLKENGTEIDEMEKDFTSKCLDQIDTRKKEGFLDSIQACSKRLIDKAIAFAQNKSLRQLKKKGDTRVVSEIKERVVSALPCMVGVMPETTYHPNALQQLNPDGILKELIKQLDDFIAYDPEKAGRALDALFSELNKGDNSSPEAKRALIKKMAEAGLIDQLIKSVVYSEMKKSLKTMKDSDPHTHALLAQLMDKKNFDKIFTPEIMKGLRPMVSEKIISPILVDGKNFTSKEIVDTKMELKTKVASILADAPNFGTRIARASIQQGLDNNDNFLTKAFATLSFGNNWDNIRASRGGRKAEDYIKKNLVLPKLMGEEIPKRELRRRAEIAKQLVADAAQGS